MAFYLVRAKPKNDLTYLRRQLDNGDICNMRPFGREMHQCLQNARIDESGWAVWEENCYCQPPLKQERMILDVYFTDLELENVRKGEGWAQIEDLPSLWDD